MVISVDRHGGGRSPRVRGSPIGRKCRGGRRRSIPACAGEPRGFGSIWGLMWVDPRVCGGATKMLWLLSAKRGRSPRVRGSRFASRRLAAVARAIPACAGEPWRGYRGRNRGRVDPRVCGGAASFMSPRAASGGRSPRVRGSRPHHGRQCHLGGSIPACAGEPLGDKPITFLPNCKRSGLSGISVGQCLYKLHNVMTALRVSESRMASLIDKP